MDHVSLAFHSAHKWGSESGEIVNKENESEIFLVGNRIKFTWPFVCIQPDIMVNQKII